MYYYLIAHIFSLDLLDLIVVSHSFANDYVLDSIMLCAHKLMSFILK